MTGSTTIFCSFPLGKLAKHTSLNGTQGQWETKFHMNRRMRSWNDEQLSPNKYRTSCFFLLAPDRQNSILSSFENKFWPWHVKATHTHSILDSCYFRCWFIVVIVVGCGGAVVVRFVRSVCVNKWLSPKPKYVFFPAKRQCTNYRL